MPTPRWVIDAHGRPTAICCDKECRQNTVEFRFEFYDSIVLGHILFL
jgi:hypothetical protein